MKPMTFGHVSEATCLMWRDTVYFLYFRFCVIGNNSYDLKCNLFRVKYTFLVSIDISYLKPGVFQLEEDWRAEDGGFMVEGKGCVCR